jgi:hypothetical protein
VKPELHKMITVNSLSGGKTSSYMAVHYPADVNVFALITIEDRRATPKDKKLVQRVSDKIGKEFIATAEDNRTLTVMFDLEQMIGREIIWLNERTYDSLFREKHLFGGIPNRLPSWARRYCTVELKMVPIFKYFFLNVLQSEDDKVLMQIGYRADEPHRKVNFLSKDAEYMKFPIACKNYGTRKQIHKRFHWRTASFPLIDNPITNFEIIRYWKDKHLNFPPQSNCAGCFHKDEVSLHLQWEEAPAQMQWFSDQEKLNKGTWLDNGLKYDRIKDLQFTIPLDFSMAGISCSGGCTD